MDGSRSSIWQEREYGTRDSRAERASLECVGARTLITRGKWNRCKKSTGIGIGGNTENWRKLAATRAATGSKTRDRSAASFAHAR
jgi:hypothetical protein